MRDGDGNFLVISPVPDRFWEKDNLNGWGIFEDEEL